ncbi:MAG: nuclear transport factor 2 family protein [Anaerolineae bacterium]
MDEPDLERVALAFVERINRGDVPRLMELMTEDHEFVDLTGDSFRGLALMQQAWTDYFRLFPDYQIQVETAAVNGDSVVLLGRSDGSLSAYGQSALRRPDGSLPDDLQGRAIWTARIRQGRVAQWRICADTPTARLCLGLGSAVPV